MNRLEYQHIHRFIECSLEEADRLPADASAAAAATQESIRALCAAVTKLTARVQQLEEEKAS